MSPSEILQTPLTLETIKAVRNHQQRNKILLYFPDTGPVRRELYPKHMEFFAAGAQYKERLFVAANRIGKSESGAYEMACHLTGVYPDWWKGRRFTQPISAWACGSTSDTTRDIVQAKLMGEVGKEGTGMIPGDKIIHVTPRRGVPGATESAWIRHISGKNSTLGFKTYEQKRKAFEGTARHVIWCDEEPPADCYTEIVFRTLTTAGIVYTTFTPLQGMTEVVKGFLEPDNKESLKHKWFIQAGWDHVPHIPAPEKAAVLATTPPHLILTRTMGEPSQGAGAIYPIPEREITCGLFEVPASWPRVYAMDVGWNCTAALWGAKDPATGIIYIYSEHYASQGEPASHAQAIKSRGDWIPGVIDPASQGSSQIDGRKLMDMYVKLGLKLTPAGNAVETGITETWQLLVNGQVKIMSHLFNFFSEFRKYHRDDKGQGKIVKRYDHLMDCLRYLVASGREKMKIRPASAPAAPKRADLGSRGWMS